MDKLIFTTVAGSHLYGLAHEGSDLDIYQVYEGKGRSLYHSLKEDDVVRGTLDAFYTRALSGSHQSVEALFSQKKEYTEEGEKWRYFIESIRITGADVFAKYERTIKKFCYGDFKRRRHACRLAMNLADLRREGRFNPEMSQVEITLANSFASCLEGDRLAEKVLQ